MPNDKQPNDNPHAQAAGAYGDHAQKHTPDQRELEGRVLLKAAKMIQDLQDNWDARTPELVEETLKYNRMIWLMFFDNANENPDGAARSDDLRANIINLANFVFKREMEILGEPEADKLNVLVNINREVAAGLMTKPGTQEPKST